jgi:hypothetical protein
MNLSILQYFKQNIKGFSTYSRENMCKSVDKLINKIERINIVGNISFLNKLYTVYTQSKKITKYPQNNDLQLVNNHLCSYSQPLLLLLIK